MNNKISIQFTLFFCVNLNGFMEGKFNYHVGNLVHLELKRQGRSVVWLASQIPCTTNNLHKILRKQSIDISLLWRISVILDHNFFQDFV